jgi:hypothetical protein
MHPGGGEADAGRRLRGVGRARRIGVKHERETLRSKLPRDGALHPGLPGSSASLALGLRMTAGVSASAVAKTIREGWVGLYPGKLPKHRQEPRPGDRRMHPNPGPCALQCVKPAASWETSRASCPPQAARGEAPSHLRATQLRSGSDPWCTALPRRSRTS